MDNNLVGQTIQGRYYVVKQLGRGGVGVTFLAKDQQCFDSKCVVKQLKPKTANSQTLAIARRLFNREAEIMNRLGHCDRIPRLLAYFEYENEFFLVQELIEGYDLSHEIICGQPWSESKTIELLQDILEVLQIVQEHGVIHRDLKPSNLMRRRQDNKIVLIDFGSVKQVSTRIIDAAGQVKQTVAVGTKSYMPMEQMMGHPGFYSDIYALGVIAIQALTGKIPKQLPIDDRGEIIWRNQLDRKVNYQPRFVDILDKMVRYRHQERYTSARVVLSELKQLDITCNNNKETIIISTRKSKSTLPQLTRLNLKVNLESTLIAQRPEAIAEKPEDPSTLINTTKSPQGLSKPKVVKSPSKNRTIIAPGLIGLLLVAAMGGWFWFKQKSADPEVELSVYENYSQGFRVDYPDVWSKLNRDDFFTTGVVFLSPLENDADLFKERVSVMVENVAEDISLTEYTKQALAEIKQLSDPNIGEAQVTNLAQEPARQIIYNGEENGNAVRRMQTWSVKNSQAYVITYTATAASYNSHLPIVEKMLKSFEIIEN